MLLLAFDTATPAITVAVHDGTDVVGRANGEGAAAHGELLTPAIVAALGEAGATTADVTDIAVGVGPGPYTGLRVGVVTALVLGHALGARTHGVCTLDVLAAGAAAAGHHGELVVATDARRREVYWAHYRLLGGVDHGGIDRVDGPHVSRPGELAGLHGDGVVVGRGAALHADVFPTARSPLDPSAADLAEAVVGRRVAELPLQPLYLRRPDVTPRYP